MMDDAHGDDGVHTPDAHQASSATGLAAPDEFYQKSPTVGSGRPEQGRKERVMGTGGRARQKKKKERNTYDRRGAMSFAVVVIGGARPVPVCETDLDVWSPSLLRLSDWVGERGVPSGEGRGRRWCEAPNVSLLTERP
jgi:hypothetical protein